MMAPAGVIRIIILGPQGSGKGTQADRLAEVTGARHIASGDLVRAEIAAGTPLGRTVRAYNDRGELVPDEIIVKMVEPALAVPGGWVLDGFPRDEAQAKLLDATLAQSGITLDRVIALQAPDAILIERLLARRQSAATGKTYNLISAPPPSSDPGPFARRADDTPEDIARRLALYHQATEPLLQHYAARGLLTTIDAAPPVDVVTEAILRALDTPPVGTATA